MPENLAESMSHSPNPAVFLKHWRAIRAAKDQHAEAGMALARLKKAAKADGVDLKAMHIVEALSKLDNDEARLLVRHQLEYARAVEIPLGTQADLFQQEETISPEALEEQREFAAGEAGTMAGKAGRIRLDNPHPAGSRYYAAWDKAWTRGNKLWLKGQEKIAGELGENANASPRRGRPRTEKAMEAAATLN